MTLLLLLAGILAFVALVLARIAPEIKPLSDTRAASFEDCVVAGNPVMESYPRQCRARDGRVFIETILPVTECVVAGCSGQLCVEAGTDGITTCEFRAEYRCYESAVCERQASGACGWTDTPQLRQCLRNPPPIEPLELQVQ